MEKSDEEEVAKNVCAELEIELLNGKLVHGGTITLAFSTNAFNLVSFLRYKNRLDYHAVGGSGKAYSRNFRVDVLVAYRSLKSSSRVDFLPVSFLSSSRASPALNSKRAAS